MDDNLCFYVFTKESNNRTYLEIRLPEASINTTEEMERENKGERKPGELEKKFLRDNVITCGRRKQQRGRYSNS